MPVKSTVLICTSVTENSLSSQWFQVNSQQHRMESFCQTLVVTRTTNKCVVFSIHACSSLLHLGRYSLDGPNYTLAAGTRLRPNPSSWNQGQHNVPGTKHTHCHISTLITRGQTFWSRRYFRWLFLQPATGQPHLVSHIINKIKNRNKKPLDFQFLCYILTSGMWNFSGLYKAHQRSLMGRCLIGLVLGMNRSRED